MSFHPATMCLQKISSLHYFALPTGDKCQVTYVWLDEKDVSPLSKTRTLDFIPSKCEDIPQWNTSCYLEELTDEATVTDLILTPVKMFRDPFVLDPHKLVFCEAYSAPGVPFGINHRSECIKSMEAAKDKKPWFGVEQEYILFDLNGVPLGWPDKYEEFTLKNPSASSRVGLKKMFGRDVCQSHYNACLYAGLKIGGTVGEAVPAQWEYQIGPCDGVEAGDHVWMSRYILNRICEDFGVVPCYDPKPIPNIRGASGGHVNFSTEDMRSEGGIRHIDEAINKLSLRHAKHMCIYDPSGGADNKRRLIGAGAYSTYTNFTCEVGNRKGSVRIPGHVKQCGQGYFEDRRPTANCNPYSVCKALVDTCLLEDNQTNENSGERA